MKNILLYRNGSNLIIQVAFVIIILLICFFPVNGQEDYQTYYNDHLRINNSGMYVLGAWAVGNIVTGAFGWSANTGRKMYFNQMNLFWNTVNLSIASLAFYGNLKTNTGILSPEEIVTMSVRIENIYLVNAALDAGYIGTGLLLRRLSATREKRQELLMGYGNSVIMQGSFLFAFDLVMFAAIRFHRLEFLEHLNLSISQGITEAGFVLNF